MSLIKLLTVFDDEQSVILNENMSLYKVAYLPVFYRYNNESFLDSLNTNSFVFSKTDSSKISSFGISSDVFQYVYGLASERGYKAMVVVCPHGKWSPYYKEALIAYKRKLRNAVYNNETEMMSVYVCDSRAFGIAPILMATKIADMYATSAMSETLLNAFIERFSKSSVTYLLSADNNAFGATGELNAYRITSNRVFKLDLNEETDEKNIEKFIQIICKAIKKSKGKFAASFGSCCTFSTRVLTILNQKYGYVPIVEAQYSIPTTSIIGINSLCIHLGEYI